MTRHTHTTLAVQVIDDLERVLDELKSIPSYTVPSDAPLEVMEAEMDRIVDIYEVIKFVQAGLRDGSIVIEKRCPQEAGNVATK